jgi:hypothetical protein
MFYCTAPWTDCSRLYFQYYTDTLFLLLAQKGQGSIEIDNQGDQKIRKKLCQNFQKIAPKVAKSIEGQTIYNKALFESPKHLKQATFETLKYLQQAML